jgi:hypothetical protein
MNDQESQKESVAPTASDYMAAAMITNGIAWVWTQVINSLTILNQIPIKFLTDITFIVYVLAGAIGAFLAGKRADSKHLQVGLKATGYSIGVNALIMLTNPMPLSMDLFWGMSVSFAAGSVFGSYMVLHRSLAAKRKARKSQVLKEV